MPSRLKLFARIKSKEPVAFGCEIRFPIVGSVPEKFIRLRSNFDPVRTSSWNPGQSSSYRNSQIKTNRKKSDDYGSTVPQGAVQSSPTRRRRRHRPAVSGSAASTVRKRNNTRLFNVIVVSQTYNSSSSNNNNKTSEKQHTRTTDTTISPLRYTTIEGNQNRQNP